MIIELIGLGFSLVEAALDPSVWAARRERRAERKAEKLAANLVRKSHRTPADNAPAA
jgi:hypothetical protein